MNRRIFFGVIVTWVLLEGSKGLYKLWAQQNKGAAGWRGIVAADIEQVVS